jgi:hypothetical protein
MLDDVDELARISPPHTLACDRSKEVPCRPDVSQVLPRVIELLVDDSSPHVRAIALEMVPGAAQTS